MKGQSLRWARLCCGVLDLPGPRADDSSFDPRPGDRVTLVDEDRETLQGRVTSRDGNHVWVQVEIPGLLSQSRVAPNSRRASPEPSALDSPPGWRCGHRPGTRHTGERGIR